MFSVALCILGKTLEVIKKSWVTWCHQHLNHVMPLCMHALWKVTSTHTTKSVPVSLNCFSQRVSSKLHASSDPRKQLQGSALSPDPPPPPQALAWESSFCWIFVATIRARICHWWFDNLRKSAGWSETTWNKLPFPPEALLAQQVQSQPIQSPRTQEQTDPCEETRVQFSRTVWLTYRSM